jgi:hypothetical protein
MAPQMSHLLPQAEIQPPDLECYKLFKTANYRIPSRLVIFGNDIQITHGSDHPCQALPAGQPGRN